MDVRDILAVRVTEPDHGGIMNRLVIHPALPGTPACLM